ncbi:MAG: hypothetical protein SFV23_12875 [Planctomycetaceae bacterium]|nr:hypothetical protein [Planctomycetaceae bacterium]
MPGEHHINGFMVVPIPPPPFSSALCRKVAFLRRLEHSKYFLFRYRPNLHLFRRMGSKLDLFHSENARRDDLPVNATNAT